MTMICAGCGASSRPNARFCDQCGLSLAGAPEQDADGGRAEVRQRTLLFCDLVRSTQLANELDLDDLRSVLSAVKRTVREVSRRHGGYVVQFLGDGAFVVFGYPAAQEDSAESAVRAGLDLVRSIHTLRAAPATRLDLRVGIASGSVVVSESALGAVIDEQSVTGRVAHLASRLVHEAPPGGVVLCDDTRRLVGQRFEFHAMGQLDLKGFPTALPAWLVSGETAPMSRFEAHRAGRGMGDMIGRDAQMHQLAQLWTLARAGQGQAVELLGDAGIGKSRIARALELLIADDQALHLDLHCTPRTSNSPLYPLSVLLRRLADVHSADDEAAGTEKARVLLTPLLPRGAADVALDCLRPLFSPRATAGSGQDSPELVRERTITILIDLVHALAARTPVLLSVEDLHWSDATTRLFLQRLLDTSSSLPMLAVVTAREAAAGMAELRFSARLVLEPLPAADSEALVHRTAGAATLAAKTVQWIVQRAEGNPLFIEELTRAACEARADAGAIPATLQNVVQARLDRLPRLKPLVQAASVLGREFSWRLLSRLTGEQSGLAGPIGKLLEDGLLVATGAASYESLRFKHALIHDAVYQTLLRSERRQLHSQTADILAHDVAVAGEAAPDLLAHHLAQAGRTSDAVRCLIDAARQTASRAAHQESIGHAEAGLKLVDLVADVDQRRSLRLGLVAQMGLSLTATLGYAAPVVEQTYADALALCDESTNPEELFPIVRGLGSYFLVRGRIVQADRLALQCIALAQRCGRSDLLIDAQSFAAYPAMYRGRFAEAQQLLEQSVALHQAEHGDRFVYANPQDPINAAWALLTTVAWMRGDLAAAVAAEAALEQHLQRVQRPFDTAYGMVWLSGSCQLQRRFGKALEVGQAGLAISQKHGFATWAPAALMQVCIASAASAPAAASITMLQQVHQAFLQAGAELSATFYQWGIAQGMLVAGDQDGARAVLQEGLQRAETGEETYMHAELLILAAAAEPDPQRAAAHLACAIHQAEQQGAIAVALRAASNWLLVAAPADDGAAIARQALAVLDGKAAPPQQPDWVASQLAVIKAALPAPSLTDTGIHTGAALPQAVFQPQVQ